MSGGGQIEDPICRFHRGRASSGAMRFPVVPRRLASSLTERAGQYPIVTVTGPRQSGGEVDMPQLSPIPAQFARALAFCAIGTQGIACAGGGGAGPCPNQDIVGHVELTIPIPSPCSGTAEWTGIVNSEELKLTCEYGESDQGFCTAVMKGDGQAASPVFCGPGLDFPILPNTIGSMTVAVNGTTFCLTRPVDHSDFRPQDSELCPFEETAKIELSPSCTDN